MPRQRNLNRVRTSSQSSVEIQISEDETRITATTTTSLPLRSTPSISHAASTDVALYQPSRDFLNVLKNVGARGRSSTKGELFTYKQLGHFLKEYIKKRQLYDVSNPAVVHCENDPLGRVFGVPSFTFYDANSLLQKHVFKIDTLRISPLKDSPPHTPKSPSGDAARIEQNSLVTSTVNDSAIEPILNHDNKASTTPQTDNKDSLASQRSATVPSIDTAATAKEPSSKSPKSVNDILERPLVSGEDTEAGSSYSREAAQSHTAQHGVKRKRRHRESGSSEGKGPTRERRITDEDRPSRRRSPSISLLVDEWAPRGSSYFECWQYVMPLIPSSDESEILSIQSKETVIVKSSSDDAWTSDEDELQLVYRTIDPPFEVEYDVESDDNSVSRQSTGGKESDSTEILEEVYLVCPESDMEWWADSESSDSESDFSSDSELAEEDKWECEKCHTHNSPLRRYCDRCMEVRPDWVPPLRPEVRRQIRRGAKADRKDQDSSSGEDECDGPTGNNIRLNNINPSSVPSGVSVVGLPGNQEIAIDSGLELGMSQDSAGIVTVGSQDSGVGGEVTAGRFDCSTPLQKNSLNLERIQNSWTPGSNISNNTSSNQDISVGGTSHGDGQSVSQGRDSALGNSLPSRSDSSPTDQHRMSLSNFQIPTTSPLKRSKSDPVHPKDHSPIDTESRWKSKSLDSLKTEANAMCKVCFNNPKDAVIIHGNTGHQVCCYQCAKRLRRRGKSCPVCRRKIQKIIRNFIV